MSKTRWIVAAVLIGLVTSIVTWRPLLRPPPARPSPALPYAAWGDGRLGDPGVNRLLATPLPSDVKLGPTLQSAINQLADASGGNFILNRRALAELGVRKDAPVSIEADGRQVGDALSSILGSIDARLRFVIDENLIMVTSAAEAGSGAVTRVYDVRDLIRFGRSVGQLSAEEQAQRDDDAEDVMQQVFGALPLNDSAKIDELSGQIMLRHMPHAQALAAHELDKIRWWRDALAFAKRAAGATSVCIVVAVALRQLIEWRAARVRARASLCKHCGYDLRATPDRCPECGNVPSIPPVVANSPA